MNGFVAKWSFLRKKVKCLLRILLKAHSAIANCCVKSYDAHFVNIFIYSYLYF